MVRMCVASIDGDEREAMCATDLRDLVRQSTRARQKLALLWLASRGAHIPKFSPPPFSRWTKDSLASPLPPHEFAGRPESPEVYRVPVPNHGAGVLVLTEAAEPSLEDGAATQLTD